LNESRSSGAALDTEFLYCCMLCGESYGCKDDLKRHKENVHQRQNSDHETADESGMDTTHFYLSVTKSGTKLLKRGAKDVSWRAEDASEYATSF